MKPSRISCLLSLVILCAIWPVLFGADESEFDLVQHVNKDPLSVKALSYDDIKDLAEVSGLAYISPCWLRGATNSGCWGFEVYANHHAFSINCNGGTSAASLLPEMRCERVCRGHWRMVTLPIHAQNGHTDACARCCPVAHFGEQRVCFDLEHATSDAVQFDFDALFARCQDDFSKRMAASNDHWLDHADVLFGRHADPRCDSMATSLIEQQPLMDAKTDHFYAQRTVEFHVDWLAEDKEFTLYFHDEILAFSVLFAADGSYERAGQLEPKRMLSVAYRCNTKGAVTGVEVCGPDSAAACEFKK